MPRKPVVTIPTDFFETGNVRALCMKKGGEEALIVYLQLLCMAVKQERAGKLMLYANIPLDDATIARLLYKTEKAVESCMQMLIDFHLIRQTAEGVYSVLCLEQKPEKKTASNRGEKKPAAVVGSAGSRGTEGKSQCWEASVLSFIKDSPFY